MSVPGDAPFGEIPFGLPDEAALARLAEEAYGPVGGGLPGVPVPGPVGSPGLPGVPGVPGAAALAAPVSAPGLGGLAASTTGASSVRPGGVPDTATLAQLAAQPYGPGSPLVTPPVVGPPAGFPDEATILRMAAAFFSYLSAPPGMPSVSGLPTTAAPTGGVLPAGAPSVPPGAVAPPMPAAGAALPTAGGSANGVHTGGVPEGMLGATPAPGRTVPTGGIPAGGATAGTVPSGALPPGSVPAEAPSETFGAAGAGPASARTVRPATGGGSLDAAAAEARAAEVPAFPAVPGPDSWTDVAPFSVPSTPYYFLGEAAALPPGAAGWLPPDRAADPACPAYYFTDPALRDGAGPLASGVTSAHRGFDVHAVRRDFPILAELVNGRRLVWLDNAATTQKPQAVIDRLAYFYAHENANVHRAVHELAKRATDAYEGARDKVARFLNAQDSSEIVFVRGTTEGINLVAAGWGRGHIGEGDEIVISHLEHHANIVPWQQLASETGAVLKVIPVDDDGQIILEEYMRLLSERTKLVAVAHVSNALGTVVPVAQVIEAAHRVGARVLVDGAQSVPHLRVDVRALDADFFVFSGHKVFAPTGIGALYGKAEVLESMTPYQTGGNMIREVTLERATFQDPPTRFEAGTGSIADAVGLGAALDYLERISFDAAARYEHDLLAYATAALTTVPGLRLVGTAADKASVLSFVLAGFRPVDVSTALNEDGIAVRAGHHCAMPIMRRFGLEATVRPSLALYNTVEEVDALVDSLQRLVADAGGARFR